LFVAYDDVQFTAPVFAGDYIEAKGYIEKSGNSSRTMVFEAYKVITSAKIEDQPSACDVLDEPVLVCKAHGTCVVPKDLQRK
ncbi:MAG: 3-aminobutyryl-CoA ammonia lyase, partial [Candidatus Muiribacterium halophilum]